MHSCHRLLPPRRFLAWSLLLAALLLGGCATRPRVDWNSRVSNYTYDQAVTEFGPPDKEAKLTDGTVVAEWIEFRGQAYARTGVTMGYPARVWIDPPSPDLCLRLTFAPDHQLKEWKRVAR